MKANNPIIKSIMDLISYIDFLIVSVIKNYRDIFKAGVFLCGLAVAGLSQPFVDLIKMDYETRKLAFAIEAQEGMPFEKVSCETMTEQKSECLQAKYEHESNFTIIKMGANLIAFFGVVGYALVVISLVGFLANSKDEYKKKRDQKPSWRKRENRTG